ncbi:PEGA domain-containing protein [candidate division WOR-3 bacterium]|nr:PEGA domain-containing protein [candidate division WOR-3 bacterium]
MKMGVIVSSLVLLAYITGACATLFKGTHNTVDFSSDPLGAKVYVNGSLMGTTPVSLKLESKRTYTIEFKKEEYETRTYTITNSVGAGWVILDVLAGLVPVIIDAATGAWYELDQTMVNAVLEEQQ